MSPLPVMHPTSERLYYAIGSAFLVDQELWDYDLANWIEAGCADLGVIDDLVRDTTDGPGWSALYDIDRVPDEHLAWLAQHVGVTIPPTIGLADQREHVKRTEGWNRGTPDAIGQAAAKHLTGPKRVRIIERDTSAYHFTVQTYESQTVDAARAEAAAREQKPGGLIMVFEVVAGGTYEELSAEFGTYDDLDAAFVTYDDQRTWVPA